MASTTSSWAPGMATHPMKTVFSGAAGWDQPGPPTGEQGWARTLPVILLVALGSLRTEVAP